jgi:hypothetical protein
MTNTAPIFNVSEADQQLYLSAVVHDVRFEIQGGCRYNKRACDLKHARLTDDEIVAAWEADGAPGLPGGSGDIGHAFAAWVRKYVRG